MPKAKLSILYREKEYAEHAYFLDGVSDMVHVEARRWSGPSCNDVVVESEVIVDGQQVISRRECRNGYGCTDAEIQRHAIALFDQLLDSHPTLRYRRHPQTNPDFTPTPPPSYEAVLREEGASPPGPSTCPNCGQDTGPDPDIRYVCAHCDAAWEVHHA